MPILTVRQNGREASVLCEKNMTLARVLEDTHKEIEQPCAGRGKCGKCRVLCGGMLSEPGEEEKELLGEAALLGGWRLACLTRIEGEAWVQPREKQAMEAIAIEGSIASFEHNPLPGDWGAAVDIGTTTVAAFLYRLADGTRAAHAAEKNPQAAWGADVISRIEQSLAGNAGALRQSITGYLNRLLAEMAQKAGIQTTEIDSVVITGNTTMLYLLTERSPASLSCAPFEADERFGSFCSAASLGLHAAEEAQVYLPRCMAAFVGADITTAVLASGMINRESPCLLVDIGTNGELALWTGETLYCCSTAAGPALEGGNLRCGMAALPGAIDSVCVRGNELVCTVIGSKPAEGLCGSGIIDAAAALLELGVLEDTGYMEDAVTLAPGVLLTQQDIRNIQLAKGAICAGIHTLLQTAGLTAEQVSTLYLAGGFGSFINLKSAAAIGLIPRELAEKTVVLGNAAGAGASMLLQSRSLIDISRSLADKAIPVELSSNPLFNDYYMECMLFETEI